jgi:hypothetical protein
MSSATIKNLAFGVAAGLLAMYIAKKVPQIGALVK